jgi:hypothetical protein
VVRKKAAVDLVMADAPLASSCVQHKGVPWAYGGHDSWSEEQVATFVASISKSSNSDDHRRNVLIALLHCALPSQTAPCFICVQLISAQTEPPLLQHSLYRHNTSSMTVVELSHGTGIDSFSY